MWNQTNKTLHNATIITINPKMEIIENGYLTIHKNKITALGSGKPPHTEHLIDVHGNIVMPGFVNAHTHLAMTNFRGIADDIPLKRWLEEHIWPAEAKYNTQDFIRKGTLLGLQEMIKTGTTTFADMYFFADTTARETANAGLRGVMNEAILDFPTNSFKNVDQAFDLVEKFILKWKNHPLIVPNINFHAPYSCSKKTIIQAKQLADKYSTHLTTHILETEKENALTFDFQQQNVMDLFANCGILNDKLSGAHCVWLSENDQQIFAKNNISAIHCPSSNLKLGSGVAPIANYIKKGINVALGTDGCASNNNLDMIEEMRLAALIQKGVNQNAELIPAQQALKMATINGAKALGLDHKIGSLEIGKLADFIIIDTKSTFLQPIFDYYSAIVYSMNSSCVDTVVVNGQALMINQVFTNDFV